jgi:hypothetical protein
VLAVPQPEQLIQEIPMLLPVLIDFLVSLIGHILLFRCEMITGILYQLLYDRRGAFRAVSRQAGIVHLVENGKQMLVMFIQLFIVHRIFLIPGNQRHLTAPHASSIIQRPDTLRIVVLVKFYHISIIEANDIGSPLSSALTHRGERAAETGCFEVSLGFEIGCPAILRKRTRIMI